jgi:asparagine synthase (glutamine-hydrolysing)
MCGICGIITKADITPTDTQRVMAMNKALVHRGPNSAGYFSAQHITLAMRRLSIIDLAGGQQPLFNEDRTIALIINGEIYNYVELRDELEAKGHVFATGSDCETVIHAYEQYGHEFIQQLRGMFAFCLYDARNEKVLLVRDRLGEKPLYLYEHKDFIAFSSEMKSLLVMLPYDKRILDPDALYTYFFYQYIPDPLTALKGVRKLPPATVLEINLSDGSQREKTYWSMCDIAPEHGSPEVTIRDILNDIETIIIRSDVPVGVSLSGGIDSSIIAILSARYYKKELHAFSVGYEGRPTHDERVFAEALAKRLRMQFHDIEIVQDEFVRDFDDMIFAMDDPIADIAGYGYYRVAREAKEVGVPVLLAGFGGDELFWGYLWAVRSVMYNRLKQHPATKPALLWNLLMSHKRELVERPWQTGSALMRQSFNADYLCYDLMPGFDFAAQNQKEMFTRSFLKDRDLSFPYSFFARHTFDQPEIDTPILLEELWMLSNCIPLGDRLSMAHSVEMRLPLLDYVLIQKTLALRKTHTTDYLLPPKQWLIDAIGSDLPNDIKERRKMGFTPPVATWIGAVVHKHRERITNGYLVRHAIISKPFLERALVNTMAYRDFLYRVLVLETWLMHYTEHHQ